MEQAIFEFMFSTGCRIGEIVALSILIGPFNLRELQEKVTRKDYFNSWLIRYIESGKDTNSAIFVTASQPHKMSVLQMRYIIKPISNRAEINKEIHPHQLRHSYATHLLNNGAPIEVIQSLLGHEKRETTRIYAQLSGRVREEYYQKYF